MYALRRVCAAHHHCEVGVRRTGTWQEVSGPLLVGPGPRGADADWRRGVYVAATGPYSPGDANEYPQQTRRLFAGYRPLGVLIASAVVSSRSWTPPKAGVLVGAIRALWRRYRHPAAWHSRSLWSRLRSAGWWPPTSRRHRAAQQRTTPTRIDPRQWRQALAAPAARQRENECKHSSRERAEPEPINPAGLLGPHGPPLYSLSTPKASRYVSTICDCPRRGFRSASTAMRFADASCPWGCSRAHARRSAEMLPKAAGTPVHRSVSDYGRPVRERSPTLFSSPHSSARRPNSAPGTTACRRRRASE
jgi:hypothetical protein